MSGRLGWGDKEAGKKGEIRLRGPFTKQLSLYSLRSGAHTYGEMSRQRTTHRLYTAVWDITRANQPNTPLATYRTQVNKDRRIKAFANSTYRVGSASSLCSLYTNPTINRETSSLVGFRSQARPPHPIPRRATLPPARALPPVAAPPAAAPRCLLARMRRLCRGGGRCSRSCHARHMTRTPRRRQALSCGARARIVDRRSSASPSTAETHSAGT